MIFPIVIAKEKGAKTKSGIIGQDSSPHCAPPHESLFCLWMPRAEHGAGGQLCGTVKAPGGRIAGFFVGLVALWRGRYGHAALAQKTGRRSADEPVHAATDVFRVLSWQLSFFNLHALRRGADRCRGGRCDHGVYTGSGGRDEFFVFARASARAHLGRGGLRGRRHQLAVAGQQPACAARSQQRHCAGAVAGTSALDRGSTLRSRLCRDR